MYFSKANPKDKVFGMVFGKGVIKKVTKSMIKVEFENGYEVKYDLDGIPSWGNFNYQTVFFRDDVDLDAVDFTSSSKTPSPAKIVKWRIKGQLEVKCPSGVWNDVDIVPWDYIEEELERGNFNKFRKKVK